MGLKISSNGSTLVKNYGEISLEGKKGCIVKTIAYFLEKTKETEQDNVLTFKIIGFIESINSEFGYKTNDIIITSEKSKNLFQCIYSEQENYSKCFYFQEGEIFPEGFYEEIFIPDKDLIYYEKISLEAVTELNNTNGTFALVDFKDIVKDLCLIKNSPALFSASLLQSVLEVNNTPIIRKIGKPSSETFNSTIMPPTIEHYRVGDSINKHKCLEIDEEFEKQSAEIYEIGKSKFCLPMKTTDLIQSCIYNGKIYWDISLLEKADKYLKEGAFVLDIGSNIGNHTLYWANERNARKVYAFEPYPYSYKILEKNVKINNLEDRVKIFPFGISDVETKGSVIGFCPTNIGGTGFENDKNGDFDFKPLDSLNIQEKIDLIKIDVEGAELNVLNGGMETIKKNLPIIIIETFSNKDKIEEMLFPLGYELVDDNRAMCDYIYGCRK